jgi:pimeloyl-ACP methyl ester carboxylesterase
MASSEGSRPELLLVHGAWRGSWCWQTVEPLLIRAFTEPPTTAAWKTIPSAFVRCDKDQIFPPVLDERAHERAGAIYRLPSSHSPFLSMPNELAALIGRIVDTAPGDR